MMPFKLHFKDKDGTLYIESIGITQLLGGKLRLDSVKNGYFSIRCAGNIFCHQFTKAPSASWRTPKLNY